MHVCPECAESRVEGGFCPNDGTALRSNDGDELIGSSIGQFKVSGLLGVGGMGRVYKGVNPNINSRVAIKVLARDCADKPELVERFFAEARAVNVIRHESIVNVLDLAQLPDRRPYIIMEYLDGAPLSSTIARSGRLPLGSFARVMTEVLSALAAAHEKQIVHRDLKPDNIFITPQGRAKVLDFGIAKLMPEHSGRSGPTRDGSLMGTPHYMSPEQCKAQQVDARTDLYAVGAILYEGVTGRPPFEGDALFDLLKQHIEVSPAPPSTARENLPPAYESVIMRALAKAPELRWQTAGELSAALAEASRELPPLEWAPIGSAESTSVPSIRSMPTPSGARGPGSAPGSGMTAPGHAPPVSGAPAGPGPLGGAPMQPPQPTPVAPLHAAQPTPAAVGQMAPRPTSGGGRGGKIALGIIGAALLAGGFVGFAFYQSQGDTSSVAANSGDDDSSESDGDETSESNDTKQAGEHSGDGGGSAGTAGDDGSETAVAGGNSGDAANSGDSGDSPATGSGVRVLGPGRTQEDTPNAKAFDITGYIPTALAKARAHFDDAILVRIDADGVYPNGRADLTLSDSFSVLYRFRSPSRAVRPKELPLGVEHKPTCLYYVSVDASTVTAYVVDGFSCDFAEIGPPKCSAESVWKKGIKKGAPSKNAVAELGYWADPKGKGRWHFSVGREHSFWVKDDC